MDCHGPKGRKKGERGAESVRTVIGKGCLWLVIYIPALVNGICRGYIYILLKILDIIKILFKKLSEYQGTVSLKTLSFLEKIITTEVPKSHS